MHTMILPSKHSHRGEFGCLSQCLLLSVASILNINASTMNAMTTCSTTWEQHGHQLSIIVTYSVHVIAFEKYGSQMGGANHF